MKKLELKNLKVKQISKEEKESIKGGTRTISFSMEL
jgi:hypothetical protein